MIVAGSSKTESSVYGGGIRLLSLVICLRMITAITAASSVNVIP